MLDAEFVPFVVFAFIWVSMGIGAILFFTKSEKQTFRLDNWGLVVLLPIVLPLLAALTFAAIYH